MSVRPSDCACAYKAKNYTKRKQVQAKLKEQEGKGKVKKKKKKPNLKRLKSLSMLTQPSSRQRRQKLIKLKLPQVHGACCS